MARTTKPDTSTLIDLMFQAFCHRMRLRILHLLDQGEMCVGNIVAILQAPQPKVSRHLAVLKKAKLVTVRREGQWIHYALAPVQSTFHQKLLECAANCFHEVTEIRGGQGTDRSDEIARQRLLLVAPGRVEGKAESLSARWRLCGPRVVSAGSSPQPMPQVAVCGYARGQVLPIVPRQGTP